MRRSWFGCPLMALARLENGSAKELMFDGWRAGAEMAWRMPPKMRSKMFCAEAGALAVMPAARIAKLKTIILFRPPIARTCSNSALTNATRRSKSLYRKSGVSNVNSLSLLIPRSVFRRC